MIRRFVDFHGVDEVDAKSTLKALISSQGLEIKEDLLDLVLGKAQGIIDLNRSAVAKLDSSGIETYARSLVTSGAVAAAAYDVRRAVSDPETKVSPTKHAQ